MYRRSDTTTKDILIIGIIHTMHARHQLWEGVCINAWASYTSADITVGNTTHHCLYAYIVSMQLKETNLQWVHSCIHLTYFSHSG